MKPATVTPPPVGALQAVQQVQAAVARQQQQHQQPSLQPPQVMSQQNPYGKGKPMLNYTQQSVPQGND